MKHLTLQVEENRLQFFLELLHSLDFVKVEDEADDNREQILSNLRLGIKEVQKIKAGKLKGRLAQELLDEL